MEAVVTTFPRFNVEITNFGGLISFTMENIYAFHKRALILLFTAFTIGYFMLNLSFNPFLNKEVSSINVLLYSLLGFMSICSLGGVYYLVTSKKYWYIGLLLLPVAFILLTALSRLMIYDVFPQIGHTAYSKISRTYKEFAILSIPRFYYYSIAALFFVFVVRYGMALVDKFKAENEKIRSELDKLEADKKALKMEIRVWGSYTNPHLLFNELNNIESKLLAWQNPAAGQLAKRIRILADIMQYNAENVLNDRLIVVIEKELAQLNRYLESRDVGRSGYSRTVVDIQGEPAGHKIVPMTLVYPTENAYTHGDLRAAPLTIRIAFTHNTLKIVFRNKIPAEKPRSQSLGSGLEITRRRLELAMPDRFLLTTHEDESYFETVLTIYQ